MFDFDFSFKDFTGYAIIFFIIIIILKICINEIVKYGLKGLFYASKKLIKLFIWILLLPFWIIKMINKTYGKNININKQKEKWWYE